MVSYLFLCLLYIVALKIWYVFNVQRVEFLNDCHGLNSTRWIVCGMMGAGKSTLARSLASRRSIEHIEIDCFQDKEELLAVAEKYAGQGWVSEANPWQIPQELVAMADTVVYLDYDNLVNYVRLLKRGCQEWREEGATLRAFKELLIERTIFDLGRIVFFYGKENRRTWEQEGIFPGVPLRSKRVVHLKSPAEADSFLNALPLQPKTSC